MLVKIAIRIFADTLSSKLRSRTRSFSSQTRTEDSKSLSWEILGGWIHSAIDCIARA